VAGVCAGGSGATLDHDFIRTPFLAELPSCFTEFTNRLRPKLTRTGLSLNMGTIEDDRVTLPSDIRHYLIRALGAPHLKVNRTARLLKNADCASPSTGC
jgi:hypothetical protein